MGCDSDDGSDASDICYMVQGDNLLEVNSEFELEFFSHILKLSIVITIL